MRYRWSATWIGGVLQVGVRYRWSATWIGGVLQEATILAEEGWGWETPQEALAALAVELAPPSAFEGIGL